MDTEIKRLSKSYLFSLLEGVTKKEHPQLLAQNRLTSKMWITPGGKIVPLLGDMHHDWFLQNASKFSLDVSQFNRGEETPIRLFALRNGFTRVNYEVRSGTVTIETNQRSFGKKLKDTIFMLVLDNSAEIDNIHINVLNDEGNVVKTGYSCLFQYDDAEKLEHLPLISESAQGKALVRVVKT